MLFFRSRLQIATRRVQSARVPEDMVASYIASVGHRLSRPPATSVERPTIHSLAVIPLTNLSSDQAQEYLCDAITDALITELAQLRAIRAISRTSIMRYKRPTESLPHIAVSSTSMASSKGQCSARMIASGSPCSSSTRPTNTSGPVYERDLKDVFALERDVTMEIARQVQAEISTGGRVAAFATTARERPGA